MAVKSAVSKVEITGWDIQHLSDACELARVFIHREKGQSFICGHDKGEIEKIEAFLHRVFDGVPDDAVIHFVK